MVDVSIVTETSQEANWNAQSDRQAGAQDHVLSQADFLTKKTKRREEKNVNLAAVISICSQRL